MRLSPLCGHSRELSGSLIDSLSAVGRSPDSCLRRLEGGCWYWSKGVGVGDTRVRRPICLGLQQKSLLKPNGEKDIHSQLVALKPLFDGLLTTGSWHLSPPCSLPPEGPLRDSGSTEGPAATPRRPLRV